MKHSSSDGLRHLRTSLTRIHVGKAAVYSNNFIMLHSPTNRSHDDVPLTGYSSNTTNGIDSMLVIKWHAMCHAKSTLFGCLPNASEQDGSQYLTREASPRVP